MLDFICHAPRCLHRVVMRTQGIPLASWAYLAAFPVGHPASFSTICCLECLAAHMTEILAAVMCVIRSCTLRRLLPGKALRHTQLHMPEYPYAAARLPSDATPGASLYHLLDRCFLCRVSQYSVHAAGILNGTVVSFKVCGSGAWFSGCNGGGKFWRERLGALSTAQ